MAYTEGELRVLLAHSKRKITNFAKYIDEFDSRRDLPSLEKRQLDIDNEFKEFQTRFTDLELLVEDPTFPSVRTEYESPNIK